MVETFDIETGFQKTELGVLPADWEVKSLVGEIDLLTGFPFASKDYSKDGIRLLRGSNVKRGVTDWTDDNTKYWKEVTSDLKAYILQDGDIVIAMDGSLVGKSFARLSKSDLPALLLQRVARIRSEKVDMGYLKEFICSEHFTKYCESVKTASAIPHISPKDIRSFKIPIPPTKGEQAAIAKAMSDANKLISALENLIVKKRNIRQGTMQELLRPKEGWVQKRLGDCLLQNPDYGINAAAVPFNESLPVYLRITDITDDGKYSKQSIVSVNNLFSSSYYLEKGDLVFARTGASVGKTYLYDSRDGKLVFAGFLIRIKVNPEILLPEYLKYFTQTKGYRDWIQSNSMRTGQPGINGNEYQELTLNLPADTSKQKRITDVLTDMEEEIVLLEKKVEKHKMLKQGMMQNLLTGKIRLI
jgi:type I restriction enzyme S subunit